jgi:plastocyanin
MTRKRSFFAAGVVLLGAMLLVLSDLLPANAQEGETRLIRVYGGFGQSEGVTTNVFRIEPETLWVKKGTVVIWVNAARSTDCLKILFEDGKKCEDVTDAPSGFLSEGPCYVTSWVTFGGTSSLKFNELGTYDYFVEAKGHGPEARKKATIVVH